MQFNKCPTGVATRDPSLAVGLVVADKKTACGNYHEDTLKTFVELMERREHRRLQKITRSHIYAAFS